MIVITDTTTYVEAVLTLLEGRNGVGGHAGYQIVIDRPTDETYTLTILEETERLTRVGFTLAAALPDGQYIYKVYSVDSGGTQLAEVERGLIQVTDSGSTFTEYATNPNAYDEYQG
jgi:hypothetical protein